MSVSIFISYSHKDKSYKDRFISHLGSLKNEGLIEDWHDGEIKAGQEWDKEINEHLIDAEIICFLVSSDFISSKYCQSVEIKEAIKRHNEEKATVIPIIVRPCDWKHSPLGKIQALPTGVKPVSKWKDADEAWLDVVKEIREIANAPKKTSQLPAKQMALTDQLITTEMANWMDDTEIQFNHKHASKMKLSDLYVTPDVNILTDNFDDLVEIVDAKSLLDSEKNLVIYGDEQIGKTSLCKYMYSSFLQAGLHPVYIRGRNIKSSKIENYFHNLVTEQYQSTEHDIVESSGKSILIIDNIADIKLSKKYQNEFLKNASATFSRVICTAHDTFRHVSREFDELDNFTSVELLPFGHVKRSEILKKWVSLGREEQIEESKLYKGIDDLKRHLDSIININVVPAKPFFILSILQILESFSPQDLEHTSSAHCYYYLICQALEKAKIRRKEIDKYMNVLTELAWAQHKHGKAFTEDTLEEFFQKYEKEYLLPDRNKVLAALLSSGLLSKRDDTVVFKYPYIFYYFVAQKISDYYNTADDTYKKELDQLLKTLHRKDSANIIIFISHHTKEDWIIDKIISCLNVLFTEFEEATLAADTLKFVSKFISSIPRLVLEQKDVPEERKKHEERQDAQDRLKESMEDAEEELLEDNELYISINKIFKGIEIAGQITRNRHASLPKDSLYNLVLTAEKGGLRFLGFHLQTSDVYKEDTIRFIQKIIEGNNTSPKTDIESRARAIYMSYIYFMIGAVIHKISSSIGSSEASPIYDTIESDMNNPAHNLINSAIKLQFKKELDIDRLDKLYQSFSKNMVCRRLLQEILIHHIYMFPISVADKQRCSEKLGIDIQGLRLVNRQQRLKM